MYELYGQLKDCIPDDHSRQVSNCYAIDAVLARKGGVRRVLDLGCGVGKSLDYFRAKDAGIDWAGLDIAASPEVNARTRTDGAFHTFDGVHIPFEDGRFDFVYSCQVLEHVRYPAELLKEVYRVLAPGGYFGGSTSQLEAYHSYSVWNYTPYGFRLLLEDAGLKLVEVRPGIDSLTLIVRRMLGKPKFFSRWWGRESPVNRVVGLLGRLRRASPSSINAAKLLFCGQFSFVAIKGPAS